MLLIYWKWKVGNGVAGLCETLGIAYDIADDSDSVDYALYDIIVPSPWVPPHHDVYKTGRVKSELDFAYEYLPRDFRIIAVTGTDGKSTTAWILYELLRMEYGEDSVYLSGNFDVPLSSTVREILSKKQKSGYIVVEVSSFMSYSLEAFAPMYSIFTNFRPDHLNWHWDLQSYLDAKMHLFHRTQKKCIINSQVIEFARVQGLSIDLPEILRVFSSDRKDLTDTTDWEDIIISGEPRYRLSDTHFSWRHNALNILAVAIVADELDISRERIKIHMRHITWLPHRLELVTEKWWIKWIDDSKSTSCQSLEAALTAFPKGSTILIAWWSDKWDTFEWLEDSLRGIKYAVLIGATRDILAEKCKLSGVTHMLALDMDDAVGRAYAQAVSDDTVLLSPGCASFWLFRDYLDRAEKFRSAIAKISE